MNKELLKKIIPSSIQAEIVMRLNYSYNIRFKVFPPGGLSMKRKRKKAYIDTVNRGVKNIPIYIISYNRLEYVKNTIQWLERYGLHNITIIDNASTYPPLLEYLNTCDHQVVFMESNKGHRVFWNDDRFAEFRKSFYVVTDPDLCPVEDCPDDFLQVFLDLLYRHPFIYKVGFSLKIDDIPRTSKFYQEVTQWENTLYSCQVENGIANVSQIDTTFALYLPDQLMVDHDFYTSLRTAFPYQCKHLPWYKDDNTISEEDKYYSATKTTGWWDPVS